MITSNNEEEKGCGRRRKKKFISVPVPCSGVLLKNSFTSRPEMPPFTQITS
jgi:hypothetical protein